MANTTLRGECLAPFYQQSFFEPSTGGFVGGRLCTPLVAGGPVCCLPCPLTDWLYADSFTRINTVAQWLSVASIVLLGFCLFSYLVLPAEATRRHYLNTGLMVSILLVDVGFVINLGAKPAQCHDAITPNDMYSSTPCAWSGAFVTAGGIGCVFWVFIRALSMHVQICWDVSPGRNFFYWSQVIGWVIPAGLFTATIVVSGVSFRFGAAACHINHHDSMATIWGWLLAIAGVTIIIQIATVAYCLHVYLRNLWSTDDDDDMRSQISEGRAPTFTSSHRAQAIRIIWTRLKAILWLQWRGLLMVTVTVCDVILFVVVFVYLDDSSTSGNPKAEAWVKCLVETGGQKEKCYSQGQHWLVNQPTIGAVLILFTNTGVACFPLMFRVSMLSGWRQWIAGRFSNKQEFVSLDAMHHAQPKQYSTSTQDSGYPYPPSQYYQNNTKGGAVFEMQSPVNPAKDYTIDNEDATTVGSPRVQSPVEPYSPPARNYSQPHPHWSRPGRTTPENSSSSGVQVDPYAGATGRTTPQDPYSLEAQGSAYHHPNPSVARSQRHRSQSPVAGQYDWTQQQQQQQQYPNGNAFAQQQYPSGNAFAPQR